MNTIHEVVKGIEVRVVSWDRRVDPFVVQTAFSCHLSMTAPGELRQIAMGG